MEALGVVGDQENASVEELRERVPSGLGGQREGDSVSRRKRHGENERGRGKRLPRAALDMHAGAACGPGRREEGVEARGRGLPPERGVSGGGGCRSVLEEVTRDPERLGEAVFEELFSLLYEAELVVEPRELLAGGCVERADAEALEELPCRDRHGRIAPHGGEHARAEGVVFPLLEGLALFPLHFGDVRVDSL